MKNVLLFVFLVLSLGGISGSLMAQPYDSMSEPYLIHHNFPNCTKKIFKQPVMTVDGGLSSAIEKDIFCNINDMVERQRNAGKTEFYSLLQRNDLKKIRFYAFSPTSNIVVKTILCNLAERGVPIDVVDAGYSDGVESDTSIELRKCSESNMHSNSFYSGGGIPSFHPKIYVIEKNDGKAILITGSGHPKRGFSYNFEHWVFHDISIISPFYKNHICFLDTIDFMIDNQLGAKDGKEYFDKCKLVYNEGGFISYFLPFDITSYRENIERDILSSKKISISMFSVGSEWILQRLLKALAYGIRVEIIVDDDTYYFYANDCKDNKQFRCQFYSSKGQYDTWVATLSEWGADIRYLQTNHKQRGQILHDKYMILRGSQTRVYFGSANFTDAAIGKDGSLMGNVENVYESTMPKVIESFSMAFERLWNLGIPLGELPKDVDQINFIEE